jgi:hypothetical protein
MWGFGHWSRSIAIMVASGGRTVTRSAVALSICAHTSLPLPRKIRDDAKIFLKADTNFLILGSIES